MEENNFNMPEEEKKDINMGTQQTTCKKSVKIVFYIFGVFCSLLTIISILCLLTPLAYSRETTGRLIQVEKLGSRYRLSIEYFIGEQKNVEHELVEEIPYKVYKTKKVKVKYNPNSGTVYLPEFEDTWDGVMVCVISCAIAYVCFQAPTNSKKAVKVIETLDRMR